MKLYMFQDNNNGHYELDQGPGMSEDTTNGRGLPVACEQSSLEVDESYVLSLDLQDQPALSRAQQAPVNCSGQSTAVTSQFITESGTPEVIKFNLIYFKARYFCKDILA